KTVLNHGREEYRKLKRGGNSLLVRWRASIRSQIERDAPRWASRLTKRKALFHARPGSDEGAAVALVFPYQTVICMGSAPCEAAGGHAAEAELTARELVTSSLMGHDSHGALRIPEYLDSVRKGQIQPGAKVTVQIRSATTAVVDCGLNFGPVGAHQAMA